MLRSTSNSQQIGCGVEACQVTILIDDNPRRARHVPEQISVERKFVEECAVLFPLPKSDHDIPHQTRQSKSLFF